MRGKVEANTAERGAPAIALFLRRSEPNATDQSAGPNATAAPDFQYHGCALTA
jgi:hypothetical protein